MPAEIHIDHVLRGEYGSRAVDAAISALAALQHGVVARWQLLDLRITPRAIEIRVEAKRLHRIHLGVYAVGHRALSREGEWLAAVLAGGAGAVLSHESAAALWELRPANARLIDVTAGPHGKRPGIRFHRIALEPTEITTRKGIPVTTPERTIIDVAATLTPGQLERAIRQAEYDHLTTLATLARRLSSRRGAAKLRTAIARAETGKGITRSKLERRFFTFLRKHGLPKPELNVDMRLDGRWIEADCLWREQCVIAELDSRDAHLNVHAFESDRRRDLELQAAGWAIVRITWRLLTEDPDALATHLYELLSRRS
jgi:predicted transcriptional regulator of viral defense system